MYWPKDISSLAIFGGQQEQLNHFCRTGLTCSIAGFFPHASGSTSNGYAKVKRIWDDGDTVELSMDMPVELIQANPKVRADAGKVAITRGPLVYCLEETDNGSNLCSISIPLDNSFTLEKDNSLPAGVVAISAKAFRTDETEWPDDLYRPAVKKEKETNIRAVPYCLWCNRKPGEMTVWIRQK